jgi:hypothetical protein
MMVEWDDRNMYVRLNERKKYMLLVHLLIFSLTMPPLKLPSIYDKNKFFVYKHLQTALFVSNRNISHTLPRWLPVLWVENGGSSSDLEYPFKADLFFKGRTRLILVFVL